MEIKNNNKGLLHSNTHTNQLLPLFNNLENHFELADKMELTPLAVLDHTEKSWKEIENFEFKKMDIKASFEQLIRRI